MTHDLHDLKKLPTLEPPADLWTAIRSEMDRTRAARLRRRIGLAAAAAVVLLVTSTIWLAHDAPTLTPTPTAEHVALDQARLASATLESALREQRRGAVYGPDLESLVWFESELGWLDTRLADRPEDTQLWRRRASLLEEMHRHYQQNDWTAQIQLTSH